MVSNSAIRCGVLELSPADAARAVRFKAKAEAEQAAREFRVPIDCAREAALPGGFLLWVIATDGHALSRDELKALAAEPEEVGDTLSDGGSLPYSKTYCGTCWKRSARNFLDIAGACGACGSKYGPGHVRPNWRADVLSVARSAADAFAAKYRCTYVVFRGDDPEPFKVAPAERLPAGLYAIHKAPPPPRT